MASAQTANFGFLDRYDPALAQIGALAERYFPDDPVTSIMKTRQLCELLAKEIAARVGALVVKSEAQVDLVGRLGRDYGLPREALQFFHFVRRVGNAANHDRVGDHATALSALKVAWQLSVWFHRSFGDGQFKPGPFQPPKPPEDPTVALREELERLRDEYRGTLNEAQRKAADAEQRAASAESARLTTEERSIKEAADRAFWENYAAEAEARAIAKLEVLQRETASLTDAAIRKRRAAIETAAANLVVDEKATRSIIDAQLRSRGWEADSENLRFSNKAARPTKGRNMAIAEWPTENGPADYALFIGTTCVGIVEAKRENKNVYDKIDQAGRYSQGFQQRGTELVAGGPWRAELKRSKEALPFRVPFLFSTNGRPYLKQIETQSGIWFRDTRQPTNIRRALMDWPTPEGVLEQIGSDKAKAHAELEAMPFDFGFALRDYQEKAIRAVEQTIYDDSKRSMLLAMATGTGKTKISIAMLYRLLTTGRFRRACFVVDRRSLGEQAQGEFKTTRVIPARTFADIFGIKELNDVKPDPDTKIHVSTIQGLVKRVLFAEKPEDVPPVDQYDLMVVDECHRGYLLDRELSDAELTFRSEADYISKYRRVLEYFDAVKIGLTATPALHTTEIFGEPIFTYSYREAVADGWLCDEEPPYHIHTALSKEGIHFKQGEELQLLDQRTGKIDLAHAPDDLNFDVGEFNKKVITREFNRVVAEELATHIDPSLPGKTLAFATTDGHADIVVDELKKAFAARYGEIEDAAVQKITGSIDAPGKAIRRFRNDTNPRVAVTVDLLTTGIDVPQIVNLVFLRRVNSRILYEQMLGRATRRSPDIDKQTFRVFDAVGITDGLKDFTTMKPVVVNPNVTMEQLFEEFVRVKNNEHRKLIRDQILVKLRRKSGRLHCDAAKEYEAVAGESPIETLERIKAAASEDLATWFKARPTIGPILDWQSDQRVSMLIPISEHVDEHRGTMRGYGSGERPEDYLAAFETFVRNNENKIVALQIVMRRPRELTRAALRDLALALDAEGYSEASLRAALRDARNEDIAATLVGYVRQAALGDPLTPWSLRVERAMSRIMKSKPWTQPQRQWLERIGRRVAELGVADRTALDEEQFQVAGGFNRINKVFDGQLETILGDINDAAWRETG
ncbi:MAG TPA: type I restriction-modification system endonuclease [Verrucomicrobiae bacterium]|nr:type I restriction-modification system endonuclease [Verrucomicrobiae bacterium]